MKPVIIYISGAHQHSGKTVTSIGLLSLLSKIYPSEDLGYIKPVGQQVIELDDGTTIDKDAQIIDRFGQIPSLDLKIVSPVQFPPTFTRDYLNSNNKVEGSIIDRIKENALKEQKENTTDYIINQFKEHLENIDSI